MPIPALEQKISPLERAKQSKIRAVLGPKGWVKSQNEWTKPIPNNEAVKGIEADLREIGVRVHNDKRFGLELRATEEVYNELVAGKSAALGG